MGKHENIFKRLFNQRPKTSPNNPPHAPAKIAPKGQPLPLNATFLVQGQHIDKASSETKVVPKCKQKTCTSDNNAETVRDTQGCKLLSKDVIESKLMAITGPVDIRVLQSTVRPPSVDNSYYDRFERLDRDLVIGDTAYKEKGGRVRSASSKSRRPRSGRKRISSAKERKRSVSASMSRRKLPDERSTGSFFVTAMSFDDETKQNTLSNAVRQISPRTVLGLNKTGCPKEKSQSADKRRRAVLRGKSRDRSPSCKRSDRSNSVSSRSVGSASVCSSRAACRSEQRKLRPRMSRSRSRRATPRPNFKGAENSSTVISETKSSSVRSISRTSRKPRTTISDEVRHRLVLSTINSLPKTEHISMPLKVTHDASNGSYAYSYSHVGLRGERKSSAKVRRSANRDEVGEIDAVLRANVVNEYSGTHNRDKLWSVDGKRAAHSASSSVPKLRMIVAPTATPLATMVRDASAKMLMRHQYHTTV
ncbi:hypothetical protein DPMN_070865 [Dreissena polymorpha]|uniref:Uncharacterized protein n=1 Tax=Dreissena polymorpha TaxID=45954 RepID=A0A9D3Z1T0_DREPO|nr:hypothetical protein DPMN_070865 [Dreissena polymorpha]